MSLNIKPSHPIGYTYIIKPKFDSNGKKIKPSFFATVMEPLRKVVSKKLGRKLSLKFSQTETAQFKATKEAFLKKPHVESISISMQKKTKQTHELDGIFIGPAKPSKKKAEEQKYIIVFYGMGDCYERHLLTLQKLANDTGANVVSYNPRGIFDSSGKATKDNDYEIDGKAILNCIKETKGAKEPNILLLAHSLGSATAANVHKEESSESSLILESSFFSLPAAAKQKEGPFTAWLAKKVGWNFNTLKSLDTVKEGKLGLVANRRDPTVNYRTASLYKKMKKENQLSAEKKVKVIKIGQKKENPETVSIKFKHIHPPKSQNKPIAIENEKEIIQDLKKAGWVKHLRHPHQPVMDQAQRKIDVIPAEVQTELDACATNDPKRKLANDLSLLNKKYAQEDALAYAAFLQMIREML